ncbi:hypothetical protein [Chitinophaga sp. 22620]|uniref:hypothetical protein n=1 Tax=Chitinophaga sp. 22620 TaxID=3453952 RepID=UPI003F824344
MKKIFLYALPLLFACNATVAPPNNDTLVQDSQRQKDTYHQLAQLVPDSVLTGDSISFMVLPLQASCPSCRDKALDSIIQFKEKVPKNHYIILSLKGGQKYIKHFFKNAGHKQIPEIPGVMFIDSVDKAGDFELYHSNPAFYYTSSGNVYRKISALPATVKEDLSEFFRGYRPKSE